MAGKYQQFAPAGSQAAHRHFNFAATTFVQLTKFAPAQSLEEAYRFPFLSPLGRKANIFPQPPDEGNVFPDKPGKPALPD